MHKGRITVAVIAGIGLLSTLFPWIEVWEMGMERGIVYDLGTRLEYGFQSWYGYLAMFFFMLIAAFALMGKKGNMIAKGIPKMAILVLSGLILLEGILILIIAGLSVTLSPQAGIYIMMIVSLCTAVAPYLFKADGTVEIPSVKEVIDDIEDSAEIVEDKAEAAADKIEDKYGLEVTHL